MNKATLIVRRPCGAIVMRATYDRASMALPMAQFYIQAGFRVEWIIRRRTA